MSALVDRWNDVARRGIEALARDEESDAFWSTQATEEDALWSEMSDEERVRVGHPDIVCAVCGTHYGRGFNASYGPNCASDVSEHEGVHYLGCHCGSDFDAELYKFSSMPEGYRSGSPTCDECVRKLLHDGLITQVPGNFPWGANFIDGEPVPV